jgi:hypothetical protein
MTPLPRLGSPPLRRLKSVIPATVLATASAATAVPGAGLSASAPMAIEGYSQGGGAADWAAQEQPGYAPGLRLKGVAAGGTPANLQAVAAVQDRRIGPPPRPAVCLALAAH